MRRSPNRPPRGTCTTPDGRGRSSRGQGAPAAPAARPPRYARASQLEDPGRLATDEIDRGFGRFLLVEPVFDHQLSEPAGVEAARHVVARGNRAERACVVDEPGQAREAGDLGDGTLEAPDR